MLVLILVVAAVAIAATQKENLKALSYAKTTSAEDLDIMITEQNEKIVTILDQLPDDLKDGVTQENIDAAVQRQKEAQETADSATDSTTATTDSQTATASGTTAESSTTTATTTTTTTTTTTVEPDVALTPAQLAAQEVVELTATLYIQKDYYIGLLDDLEAEARSAVLQLTAEERKGNKLLALAVEYYGQASDLERVADLEVVGLIGQIETILLEYGGSTTICDEIYEAYTQEKTLKKAQYMTKYAEYLP